MTSQQRSVALKAESHLSMGLKVKSEALSNCAVLAPIVSLSLLVKDCTREEGEQL